MAGLEDLFGVSDFKSSAKRGKKDSKGSDEKKDSKKKDSKKKEMKGYRYPLPVRVRCGHIRCDLKSEDYEGKTVGEAEIKNKVRSCFPELSGIDFSIVNLVNSYTQALERQEKLSLEVPDTLQMLGTAGESAKKDESEEALEFASAESEADVSSEAEDMETSEDDNEELYEEDEMLEADDENADDDDGADDSEEDAEEDGEQGKTVSSAEGTANKEFAKGCWVKLDIHYQELAKDQNVAFPITVVVGSTKMEFGDDTVSVEEIREKWIAEHPEYENCLLHYDDKQNLLIPFMRGESEIKGKKYHLPLTVGYLDLTMHIGTEDVESGETEVTQQKVREILAKRYPEFENALFYYNEKINHLFPVVNFKKENSTDRYCLPMLVRGVGFKMNLEPSDFNGRTEATLEEMRAVIEKIYPEFSKERTEMSYDERGFVVPILKGSRKGVSIVSERPNQNLFFIHGRDGEQYRVEQMPYGIFDCRIDGKEVDFHLSASKIPSNIFWEIIEFFSKDPSREAAVQIFYDPELNQYSLYYPEQKVSVCSVVFQRNYQMEMDQVLVMDVHSHGRMGAFFSSIDDHDEKGTRLFMVLGRMDTEAPEWKLRAGIAGSYKDLLLADIFKMEE